MENGKRTKASPCLEEVRAYVKQQLDKEIWQEEQRFINPHTHYLDMSPAYYNMKMEILAEARLGK